MNAMVHEKNEVPTPTSLPVWLTRLVWDLGGRSLTSERLAREAIAKHGKEAVKGALMALSSTRRPATFQQMAGHLAKLALHYPTPNMTPEQASQKFQDFFSDLKGVSEEALARACKAYRTNPKNEFFPTPGKLLALCATDKAEATRIHDGIKQLEKVLKEVARCDGCETSESEYQRSPENVQELIEQTRQKSGYQGARGEPAGDVSRRPMVPYVEATPKQKAERLEALNRRLERHTVGSRKSGSRAVGV